jgi:uncharacterized protein (DUF849 family)
VPVKACLNGARTRAEHPAVPLTPAELALDALAVRRAGAYARLRPRLAVTDKHQIAPQRPDPVGIATPSETGAQSPPIAA